MGEIRIRQDGAGKEGSSSVRRQEWDEMTSILLGMSKSITHFANLITKSGASRVIPVTRLGTYSVTTLKIVSLHKQQASKWVFLKIFSLLRNDHTSLPRHPGNTLPH